jgi:ribosomal protein S18 acetylase RimI-like enzyme
MTEAEFAVWLAESVESFAHDLSNAMDRPLDAARERAVAQFEELLPDGLESAGSHVLIVQSEAGERIGSLWLGPHPTRTDHGFVYDLVIDESMRGRGFGRAAMLAGEDVLRKDGKSAVGLNVFGFNAVALRLYEALGYKVVGTQMTKKLS